MANKQKYYLGLDIGGSSFKSGVINQANNIVYQNSVITDSQQNNTESLDNIYFLIDDALNQYPDIENIGIGLPCVVHNDKIIMAPNLLNWKDIDFGVYLRQKYTVPIAIDNDANAAAIAELIAGNGQSFDNFVYISLGTGIGGAIVINRKLYRGNIGGAGEIGHLFVDMDVCDSSMPKYRNGVLEEKIGRIAIINLAKKYIDVGLKNSSSSKTLDVSDISKLAEEQNQAACECLTIVGKYLGKAIASINHVLDISNFIIGGGVSRSDFLINVATNTAIEHSLPSVSNVNIVRAKFLNNTGIVGAALLGKHWSF